MNCVIVEYEVQRGRTLLDKQTVFGPFTLEDAKAELNDMGGIQVRYFLDCFFGTNSGLLTYERPGLWQVGTRCFEIKMLNRRSDLK